MLSHILVGGERRQAIKKLVRWSGVLAVQRDGDGAILKGSQEVALEKHLRGGGGRCKEVNHEDLMGKSIHCEETARAAQGISSLSSVHIPPSPRVRGNDTDFPWVGCWEEEETSWLCPWAGVTLTVATCGCFDPNLGMGMGTWGFEYLPQPCLAHAPQGCSAGPIVFFWPSDSAALETSSSLVPSIGQD